MAARFKPGTPLEEAIYQGDRKAVIAVLGRMDYPERQKLRPGVMQIFKLMDKASSSFDDKTRAGWGKFPSVEQHHALAAAVFLCGTAKDVAKTYYKTEQLIELARKYPPPWLAELGDELDGIHDLQALIAEKMIQRPERDEYVHGLMVLFSGRLAEATTIDAAFKADPGLKDVLLRIMEVEGTQDISLASLDKYRSSPVSWGDRLKDLSERGIYPRALLIEKAIATLERGWIQYRSGWFSSFHEMMAPSIEELRPHSQRYLGLLASRIPPTVTFALGVVSQLDKAGALEPAATLAALGPVFSSAVKGQVEAGLKLADHIVKSNPALEAMAARLILPALAHSSADVQKQVLQRLGKWTLDSATRAELGAYRDGLAAVNRAALKVLSGQEPGAVPPAPAPAPVKARPARLPAPTDQSFRIAPIADLDELVERVACVFENDTDVDEFERALAALLMAAPLDDQARQRFAPLARRVARLRKPLSQQLGRVLHFLVTGEDLQWGLAVDQSGNANLAQRHLVDRIGELLKSSARRGGLAPLCMPTHRHGYVEAGEFARRLAAYQRQGVAPGRVDFLTGFMRLAPGSFAAARKAAGSLASDDWSRALQIALGEKATLRDGGLAAAAKRLRAIAAGEVPGRRDWQVAIEKSAYGKEHTYFSIRVGHEGRGLDPVASLEMEPLKVKRRYRRFGTTVGGVDEGCIRYHASLLPSELDGFFAEGALRIGENIDWWEAQWANKAYLQELLRADVPLRGPAEVTLVLGLAGKEPGQTAVAVDALVAGNAEGRLEAASMAGTMAALLRTGHVSAARYAKSLRAALRIDPAVAPAIFTLLCAAVVADPAEPPRDTPALLELMLEISLSENLAMPAATRAALEKLVIGGKGAALRKKLLAQP